MILNLRFGILISGYSAFSKTSLNIWKFTVHVLLKPGLENFEHYFNLRLENERLLREVEYHKLRAAGYERLLEIVKEDGIDLLKKDGAKQ